MRPRRGEARDVASGSPGRGGCDMFFAAVRMSPVPMCLSDPNQPDNPLVFVNRAFEDLTGYPEDEILGRNCRFLQGPGTGSAAVAEVRRSIAAKVDVCVEFYNYRKDGSGFWNALYLSPVFSGAGDLLYFFSSQLDVTRRREAEAMLRQGQRLEAPGSTAADVAREFDDLMTIVRGSLEQARADPSSGLQAPSFRGNGQLKGREPAAPVRPDDDARTSRPAAASRNGVALVMQPVRVDTQADDEEGRLVFGDGRLVAVLVRLSGQHGALAGQWHLEHWFGLLDGPEHPRFASLDAARDWVGRQLGRAGVSR